MYNCIQLYSYTEVKVLNDEFQGSLREKVFAQLEEDIISGKYKEGQKLTENMLSEQLKVSRTPVREAIRQLELEGLVEAIPNKAIIVTGITSQDIEDIYEIRISIEGLAARRAAKNATDEILEKLRELVDLQEFYTNRKDMDHLVKLDGDFHETIFKASGSKTLRNILSTFHHNLKKARSDSFGKPARAKAVLEEHKAIFEAIEARDSIRAEHYMLIHVKNARNRVLGK
ncbi:MAG: GntR family transcriptional regulator [Clostridia bacterium]|nr:GntR family transcriptional regulator [Clostridia bacterium]MBN2882172.1 GntR family transcriptional regulator [Clostridia bacterium]